MMVDDDKDALAAEYVLGTLDADERAEAMALTAVDEGFAALVAKWERRLGELNVLVASVEPAPELWDKIKAQTAAAAQVGEVRLPGEEMPKSPPSEAETGTGEKAPPQAGAAPPAHAPKRGGRALAGLFALLAAALGLIVAGQALRPDLLPGPLRPKPIVNTVEVVKTVEMASPRPAQFVSILQKEPFSPAFLLTFDLDRKVLSVRSVGAQPQAGMSYELWLVSDKLSAPRSLGVIGAQEFTIKPAPMGLDSTTIDGATYTVSLEPQGGSKTGAPSGETVYSGKLVQTTPPGFAAKTP